MQDLDHNMSQFDVQNLLWRTIPSLIREPGLPNWRDVVEAAATNFERLGKPRYAAICRGARTEEILSAAQDEARCTELAVQAMRESGLLPPEALRIIWLDDPGPYEMALYDAIPRALEEAIVAGELDPSDESKRFRVAAGVLDVLPDGHTESVHELMLVERLELWGKRSGSQTMRELLVRAGPELAKQMDITPELLVAGVRPLAKLLHSLGEDGAEVADSELRFVAEKFGLLDVDGDVTHRTETGDLVLDHPFLIFDAVCTGLLNGSDEASRHALAPVFTMLVLAETVDFDMLVERVGMVLRETGGHGETPDDPVPDGDVSDLVLELLEDLRATGCVVDDRLTPFGREVVLACVRLRAMQGGLVA
jgi:hypothetical protein